MIIGGFDFLHCTLTGSLLYLGYDFTLLYITPSFGAVSFFDSESVFYFHS